MPSSVSPPRDNGSRSPSPVPNRPGSHDRSRSPADRRDRSLSPPPRRSSRSYSPRRDRSYSPRRGRSHSPRRRGRSPMRTGPASTSLFVGNLPYSISERQLGELFSRSGDIYNITMGYNRATQQPRGYAFVEFRSVREAEDALYHFQGYQISGRRLRIDYDMGLEKKMTQGFGRRRGPPRRYGDRYDRSPSPRRYGDRYDRSPSPRGRRSPSPRGRRSPSPRGRRYSPSPRRISPDRRSPARGSSPP